MTTKYTKVYHEDECKYNAPHHFVVGLANTPENVITPIQEVHFQEGPIKECGINGVSNEDLIAMVICRLEHFQKSGIVNNGSVGNNKEKENIVSCNI